MTAIRRTWFAAVAVAGLSALSLVAPGARAEDVVVHYMGYNQGNVGGHPMMVLQAKSMSGGAVSVPIPNEDEKKGTPTPSKDVVDTLKVLKPGAIVKLTIDKDKKTGVTLRSVEEYKSQPGEETTNGYIFSKTFDKTAGKNTTTFVVLTKFGQETQLTVPSKKGENGATEPDPEVMAQVGKLAADAPVWVQHKGNQLIAIEPYTEPRLGKLGKVGETDVDGHKVKSADVDEDGKTVTVLVPGKEVGKAWVPDAVVQGELLKQKAGSMVAFRAHEEGDKVWLREIAVAPKNAAGPAAVRDEAPAKKGAKEKEPAKDAKDAKDPKEAAAKEKK